MAAIQGNNGYDTHDVVMQFHDVGHWLDCLDEAYARFRRVGWEFVVTLRAGVDQFARNDEQRMALMEAAAEQLHISVKTVQNYVSTSRNPAALVAMELGLSIGHAVAVLGLEEERQSDLLHTAAEQGWGDDRLRYEAHVAKGGDAWLPGVRKLSIMLGAPSDVVAQLARACNLGYMREIAVALRNYLNDTQSPL